MLIGHEELLPISICTDESSHTTITSKHKNDDCGEGQETADTYKACQPFLPLSTTVLFGNFPPQNVLTEPLKKTVLNWAGAHMRITAWGLQIRTNYILFHRGTPGLFPYSL